MAVKAPQKPTHDLFDDTTMTFGEHLEALRVHLFKAIIGLVLATCVTLFFGKPLIRYINEPINDALEQAGLEGTGLDLEGFDFVDWLLVRLNLREPPPEPVVPKTDPTELTVEILPSDLSQALHEIDPEAYAKIEPDPEAEPVKLRLHSEQFAEWRKSAARTLRPITLNVQEGFMTYLKVSLVAGFVLSSPWIFYQIWLFIAAGLYPNERKYVHVYLPIALGLFLGGAFFCFYVVLPFVLNFLLSFNYQLDIVPQIRLSEWISFALLLPVMFGLSFELPLVMLLLDRLQICDARVYREKRRIAYLVIATLAMILTPAEPTSMISMMVPLIVLYEFGIWMCHLRADRGSPFGDATA